MEHFVLVFGMLLAGAAVLSIIFRFLKQSSIIAFIVVGVIAGLFKDQIHISQEIVEVFTELGIILLLFMAGLEMDFESLRRRWKIVISQGFGQILLNTSAGALLGFLILDISGVAAAVYFGLCLTFSSTIVVISYLKNRRQMESFHGQIILGLMVLQDITAVMALVILGSIGGEGSMLASIGMILLKLLGLVLVMYLLARFALYRLFHMLARSKELIFIGSLGWVMGVAAACEIVHFSPEIGAFMAGARR